MIIDGKKEFLEELINNISDGVYFLNPDRVINFWNQGAEKITGYQKNDALGKKCAHSFLDPIDEWGTKLCDDMCPALKTLKTGKNHHLKAYFRHKEGYRLPVSIKFLPLNNSQMETVGAVGIFSNDSPKLTMPQRILELERMALLDVLTQVGNRRYIEIYLKSRLEEMQKYQLSFGVIFIDIDKFKDVNKVYGIKTGDKILKMVAQTISNNIRFFDFVGRWDDDKFLVIVTNVDQTRLDFISNKIRLLAAASSILIENKLVNITVSIGASLARLIDTPESLSKRVQQLMLQSKKSGGDSVSLELKT